jgi:excisionase family DNA binding protein
METSFLAETSFMTAIEISKLLKISRALAYRLISQGQIPSIRFGKVVRVKSEDLQKFIDQSKCNTQQV